LRSATAAGSGAFLLESVLRPGAFARWSYLAFAPREQLIARGRQTWRICQGKKTSLPGSAFNELRSWMQRLGFAITEPAGREQNPKPFDNDQPPFSCGAVGFFGYGLGRLIENIPNSVEDVLDLPDMHLGFYDRVLAFDHQRKIWHGCFLPASDAQNSLQGQKVFDQFSEILTRARTEDAVPAEGLPGETVDLRSNFTKQEYQDAVVRIIEYIAAGDIFQANFSQHFSTKWSLGGLELYLRLRAVNPAPFAAYYDFGEGQIVSASPELFLRLDGRRVETRPIKGTRPRGRDQAQDDLLARELSQSPKDRAELTMIVDLERNDLGRVCSYGSVQVEEHLQLESFSSVHHLVSTVSGRLHDDRDLVDLLKATFPGGSITGAPKVRAMEIIDEMERNARGLYTGALGYIGIDGRTELNLPIRTFTLKDSQACFGVGGGIVADSDPAEEYQESLDKAQGLMQALQMVGCAEEVGRSS
jgi:para-aminobenzoate synthetase component I